MGEILKNIEKQEMSKQITNIIKDCVYTVTEYFLHDEEPIVTVFDNEKGALWFYNHLQKAGKKVCMDECPLYHTAFYNK